jgi:hypothetical protein
MRVKPRKEKEDPRFAKFKVENALPTLQKERRETDEARFTKFNAEI